MPTEGRKRRRKKSFSFVKEGQISNFIELITALKYKCFVKSPGGQFNKAIWRVITAGYNSSKTLLKYI